MFTAYILLTLLCCFFGPDNFEDSMAIAWTLFPRFQIQILAMRIKDVLYILHADSTPLDCPLGPTCIQITLSVLWPLASEKEEKTINTKTVFR